MNLKEKFNSLTNPESPDLLKTFSLPEKCIFLSDLHAGSPRGKDPLTISGTEQDIIALLKDLFAKGYTLLKGGDWWDIWRGYDLVDIRRKHDDLWILVDDFKHDNRLYEVLGNHERDRCSYPEAVIFEGFGMKIFMFHGYFGDWPNDEEWPVGRDVVRIFDDSKPSPKELSPPTAPHPSNIARHLAVRKAVRELANAHPEYHFLWGHTHWFCDSGNNVIPSSIYKNDHNAGSPTIGKIQGYRIERGVFIPL